MPKRVTSLEIALGVRLAHVTLAQWLYNELRQAILERRLPAGARLPATRDVALQYGISRGTVVATFERLQSEGYLVGRRGAGTHVSDRLPEGQLQHRQLQWRAMQLPDAVHAVRYSRPALPFRAHEPALSEFPIATWARMASYRTRRASDALLAGGDPRGYAPLREAIAEYLGSSRGVHCSADSIVIVSGAQQGLDLVARLLLKAGEAVWMESPGYFGATASFWNAGARIIPVPIDQSGLMVHEGIRSCPDAKLAYVTPAHQFPLGMTMSLERRLALLSWARRSGAYLVEDDYDSEFRFDGQPVPALQSLDETDSVVYLGSFNKVLFPSLRIGYLVLPHTLLDPLVRLRLGVDCYPSGLSQAVLCDFITEGHMGRHIRRMREMYANRLGALQAAGIKHLAGLLDISPIQAGLNTAAFLRDGVTSRQGEAMATSVGIEALALDRFAVGPIDVNGLLLGFAAFDEYAIDCGARILAAVLERGRAQSA